MDVGRGTVEKFEHLHNMMPALEIWGLDQPSAAELCKNHYNFGHWFSINRDRPRGLSRRTFDVFIAMNDIEHLEDPDMLLHAIHRLSHSNSLALISIPARVCFRGPNCLSPAYPYHARHGRMMS